MRRGWIVLAAVAALGTQYSVLSTQYSVADAQSSSPAFDLHTIDNPPLTGPLLKLQPDWSASLGGPKPSDVPAGRLVSLRRAIMPLPPHPLTEHLALAGGDRLAGTLLTLRDERLRFR